MKDKILCKYLFTGKQDHKEVAQAKGHNAPIRLVYIYVFLITLSSLIKKMFLYSKVYPHKNHHHHHHHCH